VELCAETKSKLAIRESFNQPRIIQTNSELSYIKMIGDTLENRFVCL